MKNLLYLVLLTLSASTFAQEEASYVEVTYEMTLDMDADQVINNIPQQYRAMYADQVRQEIADGIKINYILKTNGAESTYQMIERINNAQSPAGLITQQVMSQDKGVFYKNLKTQSFLKPYDIMGMNYLVKDSLPEYTWNVSREKETIAGFETRKAAGHYNDTISVTAWYAPKLTLKDGPDRVWGLPGLILKTELSANGADVTLTAISVAVKDEEIEINKPENKDVISQEEFENKMKALQEQFKAMSSEGVDTD